MVIDVQVLRSGRDRSEPVAEEDVERLRQLRAEILYRFHVPYVRIRIAKANLSDLKDVATIYRYMSDPEKYYAEVDVLYNRPVNQNDLQFLRDSGSVIKDVGPNNVSAYVQDHVIAELRKSGKVADIRPIVYGCVQM